VEVFMKRLRALQLRCSVPMFQPLRKR
jgi:hypothetical protein